MAMNPLFSLIKKTAPVFGLIYPVAAVTAALARVALESPAQALFL
jgi:hypothetical protein